MTPKMQAKKPKDKVKQTNYQQVKLKELQK
jgi:hypothetical protein